MMPIGKPKVIGKKSVFLPLYSREIPRFLAGVLALASAMRDNWKTWYISREVNKE
jgi:hypothetical protein